MSAGLLWKYVMTLYFLDVHSYIYIYKKERIRKREQQKKKVMKREKTTEELKDAVLFDC